MQLLKTYHNRDYKVTQITLVWIRKNGMEKNRISKRVLYMNLEIARPKGRPKNK
jgi:hypothetical protein